MNIDEAFAAAKTNQRVWIIRYGEIDEGRVSYVQSGGTGEGRIEVRVEVGEIAGGNIFTDSQAARDELKRRRDAVVG